MFDFQPPDYLEDDTTPQTQTDALIERIEEIESVLLNGNTWRYVNGSSAVGALVVATLGGGILSPLSTLLLLSGSAVGVISYASYVFWEGKELGIKPSPAPISSGEKESIEDLLPREYKTHCRLIQWYGRDAMNWIESQGCLAEVIRHAEIKGTNALEVQAYTEKLKVAIANHYLAEYPRRKAAMPQAMQPPAIAPQSRNLSPAPPAEPSPMEVSNDAWDETLPEIPEKKPEQGLETPQLSAPIKVLSIADIEQSQSAPTYDWSNITKAPHLLVVGSTGDGKSTLVKWLVQTYYSDSTLMIIDPHAGIDDWGNLEVIGKGRNYRDAVVAFGWLHSEMTRRYQVRATTKEPVFERLVVVVDEFAAIAKNAPGVSKSMMGIAQEGRKVGIVLCLLSQGENVKTLGIEGEGEQRENFCRIRLGSFAQKMVERMGKTNLASQYPRFCFVEENFAALPDLSDFQLTSAPQVEPEPSAPVFTANDLLTYLEKKEGRQFKPRELAANLKLPTEQILIAANNLIQSEAEGIEVVNWGRNGAAIGYFKPQESTNYNNVIPYPFGA